MTLRSRAGIMLLAITASAAATVLASRMAPQTQRFVSGVEEVSVNVSVRQGNAPIAGLKPEDFDIADNGVPQTANFATDASLPIDMTLVVDNSGSVQDVIQQLKRDAVETSKMLHDGDRMRLLTFTETVTETSPFQPASTPLALDRLPAPGMTSIYEAAATALMRKPTADRHELIVLFTDGVDTTSTVSGAAVLDIARRSDALLHIFYVKNSAATNRNAVPTLTGSSDHSNNTRGAWFPFTLPNDPIAESRLALEPAAETTGGELEDIFSDAPVPHSLQNVIDDTHASYIVYYTPKNVAKPGWHDVKIKLKRPGDFSIRARKGYFGPAK